MSEKITISEWLSHRLQNGKLMNLILVRLNSMCSPDNTFFCAEDIASLLLENWTVEEIEEWLNEGESK